MRPNVLYGIEKSYGGGKGGRWEDEGMCSNSTKTSKFRI